MSLPPRIFFTADPHFFHFNIIRLCNRPFKTAEEMNEQIIRNWCSIVRDKDTVYLLGDLSWKGPSQTIPILKELTGTIHFIEGNHDKTAYNIRNQFASYERLKEITVTIDNEPTKIVLCHYPMRDWNGRFRGAWHLYGHAHGNAESGRVPFSFDVGMDCHDFTPVSLEQVTELMIKRFVLPNHNQENTP